MSHVREQFRHVLARPICTLAANIFDPLSARIAHLLGYDVCVLSGSVGRSRTLACRISYCPTCQTSSITADGSPVWPRSASWSMPRTVSVTLSMSSGR